MSAKSIIPCIGYKNAIPAIEWLCDAFGFKKHEIFLGENGIVGHAELKLGHAMVMVGSQQHDSPYSRLTQHPDDARHLETQSPYVVIDDIDAHYKKALKHGARIAIDLKQESYGGKNYSCYDIEGHLWTFGSYDPWAKEALADMEDLKKTEEAWNKAIEVNNVKLMAQYMADEWIIVGESGMSTKENFLQMVKSGLLIHSTMDFNIEKVQVYGNFGTVLQKGTSAGTYNGNNFSLYEWATTYFKRDADKWQAVQTMTSPARCAT